MASKREIREFVWRLLEEKGVAAFPLPARGRIPNFKGAREAALRLRGLEEYRRAKVVFCTPDSPQRPVREFVLRDGKTLLMASPRIKRGFVLVDPTADPREASTIRGAFKFGRIVYAPETKIDLLVVGSVAVSPSGYRLGKGTGYFDREFKILQRYRCIDEKTPIATTIHDLQIVEDLPVDPWDVPVDIIVTPTRVMRVKKQRVR